MFSLPDYCSIVDTVKALTVGLTGVFKKRTEVECKIGLTRGLCKVKISMHKTCNSPTE